MLHGVQAPLSGYMFSGFEVYRRKPKPYKLLIRTLIAFIYLRCERQAHVRPLSLPV